jgi:hypothetical protein
MSRTKALASVDLRALVAAAKLAAWYEDAEGHETRGSPWCGVCHRSVQDCDLEPEARRDNGQPPGPCPGNLLRIALGIG